MKNRYRKQSELNDLLSMVDSERLSRVMLSLLLKLTKPYRERICRALKYYMLYGTKAKFQDTWLNRWYQCLVLEIELEKMINND